MNRYILVDKEPVLCQDFREWGKWMMQAKKITKDGHHRGEARVGWTKIGEVQISTVFLGVDHSFTGGPPILFETMVFGGSLDEEMERYATWAEAEAGHAAMVQRVRDAGGSAGAG